MLHYRGIPSIDRVHADFARPPLFAASDQEGKARIDPTWESASGLPRVRTKPPEVIGPFHLWRRASPISLIADARLRHHEQLKAFLAQAIKNRRSRDVRVSVRAGHDGDHCKKTDDAREAQSAFREKRAPEFVGR